MGRFISMITRFKRMLFKNAFLCVRLNHKAASIAKKDIMPDEQRFLYAIKFVKKYHKDMKVNIKSFGLENIDKNMKGCMIISNHQGRNDCVVILQTLENFTCSFVIDDAKSHQYMFSKVCDMLHAKRIKFNDLRSQVQVYNEMTEEIKNGRRYIVFPEAGYKDNKNNLQEFNSACFSPVIKSQCPIIPICLYDTWKVFDENYQSRKTLEVECHVLPPIFYEDYKGFSKQELADLVKMKINDKLNEIKNNKNMEELK